MSKPPPIRAALFDMDGLLLDSEDKYTLSTNTILSRYSKPPLPWHIKAQLQGRPGPQAGKIFAEWANLPISREEYLRQAQELQKDLFPTCKFLPGAREVLKGLKERRVEMALATSSMRANFELKTDHLRGVFDEFFARENQVLGDDRRIPKGRGKPAPDIYLLALETVNARLKRERGSEARLVSPQECLVFEDSVPGVEAGRRAGMQVVWCPHEGLLREYQGREELVLAGLCGEYEEVEARNEDLGVVVEDGEKRETGPPGVVGDGWARMVASLENFPYADYGIQV